MNDSRATLTYSTIPVFIAAIFVMRTCLLGCISKSEVVGSERLRFGQFQYEPYGFGQNFNVVGIAKVVKPDRRVCERVLRGQTNFSWKTKHRLWYYRPSIRVTP